MELISKLGIDWKLLIAQIINFFILLFVLYKFAYKPILDLLDKRSKTIEKSMHDAKEIEKRLVEIEKMRDEKLSHTSREIGKMIEQAKVEAEVMKKEIVVQANSQAQDLLRRSRLQMVEEKEKMIQEVKAEVVAFIVAATGKLLEKEFSQADQKRLTDVVAKEVSHI